MIVREFSTKEVWDDRSWVWGCGGPTGCGGHHGMLDYSRTIRLPFSALPFDVVQLAHELDSRLGNRQPFMAFLERTYERS